MTTAEQHIADLARGAQEFAINTGLERDGIGQRVCLHADQTLRQDEAQALDVLACDYCSTVAVCMPGTPTELPAWYWRAP